MTKILIVDDSKNIQIQLKTGLTTNDSNYNVIEAHDGLDGVIAWVTKPHKPKMLLGGIKKILSSS